MITYDVISVVGMEIQIELIVDMVGDSSLYRLD